MRNLLRALSIGSAAVACLWIGHGAAQASIDSLRFTTRFAFTAGTAQIPPGTYDIRRSNANPQLLEIDNALTGRHMGLMIVNNSSTGHMALPFEAGLEFERVTDQHAPYVLTRLWDAGAGTLAEPVAARATIAREERAERPNHPDTFVPAAIH